jgi:hypothetical protein
LKKLYSLTLIFLSFLKLNIALGQVCDGYSYICSSISSENFTQYNNIISLPLVENGNSCDRGTFDSPICGSANLENQTWIMAKVLNPTAYDLILNYAVSSNQNISISVYGNFSYIPNNLCAYMKAFPNFCKPKTKNSSILIEHTFNESYIFICIVNETNTPGYVTLWPENANMEFYHFTPVKDLTCEKPTAKLTDEDLLLREEETFLFRPKVKFTGTPPFYYTFPNGHTEIAAYGNDAELPTYLYSPKSTEIQLGTVRNTCGYGTIDPKILKYLIYDKDTNQVTCLPFDNDYIDQQTGTRFMYTSGTFVPDQENTLNKAIEFNGTDEYLKFPGRDLKGENFVMSLWVKPSSNTNDSQTILSLGGDILRQNQLRFRKFGENQYRYEFELYTRNGERYLAIIPAEIDKWVHLTLVKTATLILIKDNNGRSNDYTFSGFDVPLLGNNSILWFACDAQKNNKFRGRINNFKYFTGGLPNAYLQNLPNQNDCSFQLCDEIPVVTLPGFINQIPGTTLVSLSVKIDSQPNDTYKVRTDGSLPYYLSNFYSNTFSFLSYKKDNTFSIFDKISNKCGNGIYKDTLVISENPTLKYCFNFNQSNREYFGTFIGENNINSYTADRNNNPNKAAKFISNTSLEILRPSGLQSNNYTMAFWLKPNATFAPNQEFQIFEYFYLLYDRLSLRKNNDLSYTLTFQKYNEGKTFSINLPNISDQWTHFAIVYQSGNSTVKGNLRIYVNGEELKNTYINGLSSDNTYAYFRMGSTSNPASSAFEIDDYKIYLGGLSKTEVNKLYSQTSECLANTCDNSPNLAFSFLPPIFEYGEKLKLQGKLTQYGPVKYTMQLNSFTPSLEPEKKKSFEEENNNYSLFKTGDNFMKISGISNSCMNRLDTLKYSFYIKPKVVNCLPFNSANWNTNTNTETFETENLILTSDRKGSPAKALAFQSNSKLLVTSNASKGLNHSISFWINIKSNSPDSFQVYFAGNATNNFQVKLKKTNGKYSIVGTRNGSFLKYENYKRVVSAAEINPETWSHIAVSFENSGMAIYLNGNLLTQRLDPVNSYTFVGILNLDKLNYRIGSDINNTQKMVADIDDFKFFDGGLNVHEAKYLANSSDCDFNYCPKNTIITNGIASNGVYFGGEFIKATNTVNQRTAYFSDQTIVLEPGFNTQNEAIFRAEIKNCGTLND